MKKTKYTTILIIGFLLCSCVNENYKSYRASLVFNSYWTDDISKTKEYNSILVGNDSLDLRSIKYIISDLKLISSSDTIKIRESQILRFNSFLEFEYQISFNFGLKDIKKEYHNLKAQNFDIENGYYFLKMDFSNKSKDSLYNYIIAKKNLTSVVQSFNVKINGFKPSNGQFNSQAKIGVDLKKLFKNPNFIHIDSLNSDSIHNNNLQKKMSENTQDIFFLEEFIYN
ncbi:MAG: hypothetical protein AB8B78_10960 [Polaribacter sp.]